LRCFFPRAGSWPMLKMLYFWIRDMSVYVGSVLLKGKRFKLTFAFENYAKRGEKFWKLRR